MKHHLIFLFLFVFSATVYAYQPTDDTAFRNMADTIGFKKKLAASSQQLVSMECDFTQMKYTEMLNKPAVSEGMFYYLNTKKIRWEYTQPFSFIFIINDDKLILVDEDKVNRFDLSANTAFTAINDFLTAIMDGSIAGGRSGFSHRFLENDHQYRLDLSSLKGGEHLYFTAVSVYYGKGNFGIEEIAITDHLGDIMHVKFRNIKTNQPLSDEKFIVR